MSNNVENNANNNNIHGTNQQYVSTSNDAMSFQQQQLLLQQQLMQSQMNQDDEIDLSELWRAIWSGKKLIIAITFVFAIASVAFALSKPNIYQASTLLAPASGEGGGGGLAALAGQFGGLASMAGINLGGGGTDKTGLALEVLKSRVFIERFIKEHQLLVPLMAVKKWDINSDKLIYNEDIYDITAQKWIREVKFPKTPEPSAWESYKAFNDIFSVSTDKESGMVTISIEYFSPKIAIEWVTLLVKEINETIREKDKKEAQQSIAFLEKKLEQTRLADMQTVFYQLIEEQTKTMMLAEVSKEYVLKTIDPANAPDEKAKPKRALIVVLGTMLGGMLSVLIVLIRYFSSKKKPTK